MHEHPSLSSFRPIADYGLLSDCNSAALVDRYGSIDWLCLPRFDSPALFSRILDPDAGHWSIRPAEPFTTRAALSAGNARDRDHLHDGLRGRAPDRCDGVRRGPARARPRPRPPHELLRSVECLSGRGRAAAGARAAARVRARPPAVPAHEGRRPHVRRPVPGRRRGVRAGDHRRLDHARRLQARGGRAGGVLAAVGAGRGVERRSRRRAEAGRRPDRRHGRGVALVGGRARPLRGPAQGARAVQLARAQGPHLSPHRRDRRRAHDVAARGRGRRAQLGLPLLRGSGTRASRSRRSTSAPAPTRPRTSSRS